MALIRNAIWNLSGQVLPMLAALVVIPLLINTVGNEKFGLITIIWTLIGYFSLFDFGLGRALTKFISFELSLKNSKSIPDLIITALLMLLGLGVIVAFIIWTFVPWLVIEVLKVSSNETQKIIPAFYLVSILIPCVLINVGLRAILEGFEYFNFTNYIRLPFGLFTIISPVFVVNFGYGLYEVVLVISFGILFVTLGYLFFLKKILINFQVFSGKISFQIALKLFGFGGWISISNFVGPLIFYLDRFIISSTLSVAIMAYYVTPAEAITKSLIFSSAIAGVFFPIFSKASNNKNIFLLTMYKVVKVISIFLIPIFIFASVFSYELLELWVNRDMAINGSAVLIILTVGVFFNALAYMPYTLLQASGRADLVAKIQLIQLPFYPILLWFSVVNWNIEGAAIVWVGRAFFEMYVFFFFVEEKNNIQVINYKLLGYLVIGILIYILGYIFNNLLVIHKTVIYIIALIVYSIFIWNFILLKDEKYFLNDKFKMVFFKK